MLSNAIVHPSLATADIDRAKAWYEQRLGWRPFRELEGLLVYAVDGTVMTVFATPLAGTAQNTVAIWVVDDLRAEMARLRSRGVVFEEYDFEDFKTVDGIAVDDSGHLAAWFRDADGNYIGVGERGSSADEERGELGIGAMIAAKDLARARDWYLAKLDFSPFREYPGEVLIYRSGLSRFSIYQTPSAGTAKNTVAVWRVRNVRAEVAALRGRGVVFEDYDFGDARTVDGIMTDSDGAEIAWFKDSEDNVLGLVQIREADGF